MNYKGSWIDRIEVESLYFIRKEVLFVLLFLPFLLFFTISLNGAEFTYERDGESGVIELNTPLLLLSFSALFGGVAALALEAIAYGMGLVQSPSERLYPNIPPVSMEELISRLLALNDPNNPWEVVQENGYFIARWKLVDAKWWELLRRAGLKIYYLGRMKLVDETKTVLYVEEIGELEWTIGFSERPVELRYSKFRGRVLFNKRKAVAYAFKRMLPPDWGKVYRFDFDVNTIRGPIIETVERAGWLFQPVTRL